MFCSEKKLEHMRVPVNNLCKWSVSSANHIIGCYEWIITLGCIYEQPIIQVISFNITNYKASQYVLFK